DFALVFGDADLFAVEADVRAFGAGGDRDLPIERDRRHDHVDLAFDGDVDRSRFAGDLLALELHRVRAGREIALPRCGADLFAVDVNGHPRAVLLFDGDVAGGDDGGEVDVDLLLLLLGGGELA